MPFFKTEQEREAYEKAKNAKLTQRKTYYMNSIREEMTKRGWKPDKDLHTINGIRTWFMIDEYRHSTWDRDGSGMLRISFKCNNAKGDRRFSTKEKSDTVFSAKRISTIADKLEEQLKTAQTRAKVRAANKAKQGEKKAAAAEINANLGLTPFESDAWATVKNKRLTVNLPYNLSEDEISAILTLIKDSRA